MPRKTHNDAKDPGADTCRRPGCSHIRRKHAGGKCTGLHYDPFGPAQPCECAEFVEPRPVDASPAKLAERVVINMTWWGGDIPKIDEYLKSKGRATRFAYRIIDVHAHKVRDGRAETQTLEIGALRVLPKDVPEGAKVHELRWNDRGRKLRSKGAGWGE